MNEPKFKSKLNSVMKDNMFDRNIGRLKSGKVDGRSLAKIGFSNKIFKKKQERKGKHYNVSILIDCSGSMYKWSRIDPLVAALRKIVPVLQKMPYISIEILGFNTFVHEFQAFGSKNIEMSSLEKSIRDKSWSKRNDTDIFKIDEDKKRFIRYSDPKFLESYGSTENDCQGNCDGMAVNQAYRRLKKQKGKSVLIVFSDGCPHFDSGMNYWVDGYKEYEDMKYSDFDLKKEVKAAVHDDVAVIGIGIESNDVQKYYPAENVAVINDTSKIYESIINLLDKQIKRG